MEVRNGEEMLQFLKVVGEGHTEKTKPSTDLMEVREPAASNGEEW